MRAAEGAVGAIAVDRSTDRSIARPGGGAGCRPIDRPPTSKWLASRGVRRAVGPFGGDRPSSTLDDDDDDDDDDDGVRAMMRGGRGGRGGGGGGGGHAPSLAGMVDARVHVITNDGRHVVGTLRGFDQVTNVILEGCSERVYSSERGVEEAPLGLYMIRGDNVCVLSSDSNA